MALAGRKRPHSAIDDPEVQFPKRHRKVLPSIKDTTAGNATNECPAAIFRTPSNSQATLSGLPAELRLQIYSYLCDSTIIHVHNHRNDVGKCRFTWTPCRSPSSASPLLCANPKWSGMCDEEDRCTYKIETPPEPVGFWGLAASNKLIRNEAQEFFLRKTVVSIHPQDLRVWLEHLASKDSRRLDSLRRVTLAGPNSYQYLNNAELQLLRDRLPNLEALGLQCQDSVWRWVRSRNHDDIQIDGEAWKRWHLVDWMRQFDPSITIAMEAMIWQKAHPRWNTTLTEQQVAIRMIREGKPPSPGLTLGLGSRFTDEDVEVEIIKPGKLASGKRNAKWRQWWRGKTFKGFA